MSVPLQSANFVVMLSSYLQYYWLNILAPVASLEKKGLSNVELKYNDHFSKLRL